VFVVTDEHALELKIRRASTSVQHGIQACQLLQDNVQVRDIVMGFHVLHVMHVLVPVREIGKAVFDLAGRALEVG
jgi:hypothetical protein